MKLHYIKNKYGFQMWNIYELQAFAKRKQLWPPNMEYWKDYRCEGTDMANNVKYLRLAT